MRTDVMANNLTNITCPDYTQFRCNTGIILPLIIESTWSDGFRGFIYLTGLLWSFLAISIIADIFMCAIEVITSKTTEVKVARPDLEEGFETVKVRVWNDTVANLTLMALGSSAPEILLSVIEIVGNKFHAGELGPGTIVGSASFNLFVIIAVCVYSIPDGEKRRIHRMKVFLTTAFFAVFAYGWIYIVLAVQTPNEVEIWEACVTFAFFPVLVILAFLADKDICMKKEPKDKRLEIELGNVNEDTVLMKRPKSEDDRMQEVVSAFMRSMDKPEKITEEDASNIAALKMQVKTSTIIIRAGYQVLKYDEMPHSRAWYRVKVSRELLGGQRINPRISSNLQRPRNGAATTNQRIVEVDGLLGYDVKLTTEIEFDAVSCSVMENCGTVKIIVVRTGDLSADASVSYETFDGTANAGDDYVSVSGTLTFGPKETRKEIEIEIIDDNVWEPDETFFVKLSIPESDLKENGRNYVKLGRKVINQITIINDDEPGTIEFTKPSYLVKESIGTAYIPLQRTGADGIVNVEYRTSDVSGKDGVHYRGKQGTVTFEHGEDLKNIDIEIINDHKTKKDENFQIVLTLLQWCRIKSELMAANSKFRRVGLNDIYKPVSRSILYPALLLLFVRVLSQITILSVSGGATLGHTQKTVVTVVGDDEFDGLVRRVVAKTHLKLLKMKLGSQSWTEQFTQAMTVNGGDTESATAADYAMHFLTFGFKVIFAIVPPPSIWGGWACFAVSLGFIAILTAIVGDLAGIFGCIIGLKPTVVAITFVALGTSLPDLFASKILATTEPYADNSIGNVTGSNSVNVFLGLGLPWVIASIYWKVTANINFPVDAGSTGFSVALYSVAAIIAIATLIARHYAPILGAAELGGPKIPKIVTVVFFILLWLLYVLLSSLQAYGHIAGF
uniref:Calx-beta domain-containing protein n=1 Tax=Ciona intestinalis TaxID=7719 RepID=F6YY65_CIOIN